MEQKMDKTQETGCEWINEDYFESLLKAKENDDSVKVVNISISRACGKGENYCSKMYRARVFYACQGGPQKMVSVVLKTPLKSDEGGSTLDKYKLFEKELTVFNTILPLINAKNEKCGIQVTLAAKLVGFDLFRKCLIFEDLQEKNFRNIDKREGLSFDYLKLIIQKLALWHAATATIGAEDESIMNVHKFPPVCQEITDFHEVYVKTLYICGVVASTWPGFEDVSMKLKNLSTTIIDKLSKVFSSDPSEFNVLTHGDVWTNNIMFKFSSQGELQDFVFVDYAVGFWGSPAIDLAYLLFTSADSSLSEQEIDYLIHDYHNHLVHFLSMYNYSKRIPTLDDIRIPMRTKGYYGIAVSIFLQALRVTENSEKANITNLIGDNEEAREFQREIFNNSKYKRNMQSLLSYLNKQGYL